MRKMIVGLIGNPNCGKSTLFNALTRSKQKVGNWPGVTVACQTGELVGHSSIQIVDLPGIYQLALGQNQALDELITCDFILGQQIDLILNVIDAVHLERHLFLTLQLLALKVPMIVVVNKLDVARHNQLSLDLPQMTKLLGCPVVGTMAHKGNGITSIVKALCSPVTVSPIRTTHPQVVQNAMMVIEDALSQIQPDLSHCAGWLSQELLQGVDGSRHQVSVPITELAAQQRLQVEAVLNEDVDIMIADALYTHANAIAADVATQGAAAKDMTRYIDRFVLNRFWGLPIFLLVMYLMFSFAINLGGAFQEFFNVSSDALFVQGMSELLQSWHAPSSLVALIAAGLGRGINTTISFIPVIGAMFFFLALLESSGYMARATFVIDRFMRMIGLPGKAFLPMIIGFGCNVPAILATRTLESKRDRVLTILMSPFMSCGARLAIFAVFTAAFFPNHGQNIVFALYLIGILAAVLTGYILRKTLLQGESTPLVLELPPYHFPSVNRLLRQTGQSLKDFIIRAGKLIIPVCMVLGLINTLTLDGKFSHSQAHTHSWLSYIGRMVTPVLSPMGIQNENWPATVGLVTGVMAKEVVIATLNTLYTQESGHSEPEQLETIPQQLWAALLSIPINLHILPSNAQTSAAQTALNDHAYGALCQRFAGPVGAFAYLLFVLLYFPCMSATAAMTKELNKKWALFSVAWSTGVAYLVATSFFQMATMRLHPLQSLLWVSTGAAIFLAGVTLMKYYGQTFMGDNPLLRPMISPDDFRHEL